MATCPTSAHVDRIAVDIDSLHEREVDDPHQSRSLPDLVRTEMKKTFTLTHPKIKAARLVESAIHEVRKYLKRERKKTLPEGADFWDFDCRFGPSPEEARVVHVAELDKLIGAAEELNLQSFYVEILAKPGHRTKKPNPAPENDSPKTAP
jgi:hypothetical protein